MLERIVGNLFGNAVRYVKEGGIIRFIAVQEKEGTHVEVFNSGDKIPETELDKVWDIFYKVDKSRKRNREGHGIGLAIVKSAVELHQGTVFAENRQDGISFGFFLPETSQELHTGKID